MVKFTGYEKYKDSGLEWFGEIPVKWTYDAIKRLVKIPITDGPHETPELVDEGIPFISAEAIKNNLIDFERKRGFITAKDNEKFSKKYKPQKGDLYMVKSGATTGNVAIVNTDIEFNIWSPLAVIRVDHKKVNFKYIFYLMLSRSFFKSVQLGWSWGTQQNIGMNVIENLFVLIPSLETQISIASYLDGKVSQVNREIELLQVKKEKYQKLRKTLINEAVTKGIDKRVKLKESGVEWLGKIPKHWRVVRSKNLFEHVSIKNHPNKKLLSIYRDYGVIEKTSRDDNHNRASDDLSNYKLVKNGYLVINKMKAWQGSVAISNLEGIVSPAYITCKPIGKEHNFYFHYLLRSAACITEFQRFSYGVRPGQWDLRYADFADFMLTVPPLGEQIAIAKYLDEKTSKIDSIISKIDETIKALNEFKNALINDAVTGKIKVV